MQKCFIVNVRLSSKYASARLSISFIFLPTSFIWSITSPIFTRFQKQNLLIMADFQKCRIPYPSKFVKEFSKSCKNSSIKAGLPHFLDLWYESYIALWSCQFKVSPKWEKKGKKQKKKEKSKLWHECCGQGGSSRNQLNVRTIQIFYITISLIV